MPEVAPIATMLTFSSSVLLPRKSAEKPTARMAMGMAGSIPCPSLSAMNAEAPEKSTPITVPTMTERTVTSATRRAGAMTGWYVSPGWSSRYAFSGSLVGDASVAAPPPPPAVALGCVSLIVPPV